MDLFVVYDTKGSGRLVGVFDDRSHAEEIVQINPQYFKLRACALNKVNADVVRWALSERERGLLLTLVSQS